MQKIHENLETLRNLHPLVFFLFGGLFSPTHTYPFDLHIRNLKIWMQREYLDTELYLQNEFY